MSTFLNEMDRNVRRELTLPSYQDFKELQNNFEVIKDLLEDYKARLRKVDYARHLGCNSRSLFFHPFPGKPLAKIAGRSMVLRVCDQIKCCKQISDFVVATDDERIFEEVKSNGYPVVMTAVDHQSGTDRIAEVAKSRRIMDFKYTGG